MNKLSVHVVGAGLAGLAAAVRLAGGPREIVLHEAARQAGGRCRSFYDPALGLMIDNGNHLLLSGNHAARKLFGGDRERGPIGGAAGSRCLHSSISQPRSAGVYARMQGGFPGGFSRRSGGCRAPAHSIILASCGFLLPATTRRSARSCAATDCFMSGCGGRFFSLP